MAIKQGCSVLDAAIRRTLQPMPCRREFAEFAVYAADLRRGDRELRFSIAQLDEGGFDVPHTQKLKRVRACRSALLIDWRRRIAIPWGVLQVIKGIILSN